MKIFNRKGYEMGKRVTKMQQITKHLETRRSITSLEAIKYYGATRLSDIIFKLRNKGYNIVSMNEDTKDRNGNRCSYVRYVLKDLAL